jgi:uncharacterized protein YvpB
MKLKISLLLIIVFLPVYTIFWIHFLKTPNIPTTKSSIDKLSGTYISQKKVLSANTTKTITKAIPASYKIFLPPRRQFFNLSCEMAAASAILYQLTNDQGFSPKNEESAEKNLIAELGVSANPNIGIRMGEDSPIDTARLYANLNQKFSGTEYYGIHAPPFIDLFEKYNLTARPIANKYLKSEIEKAVSEKHLIMTWIKIGYGKPIDISLSYGANITIVKGEHAVVINGYDQNGVFIMDPGIGKTRYISYSDLISATRSFTIPFLEIYKATNNNTYFSLKNILPFANFLGLNRQLVTIKIDNGNGQTGEGSRMANILKDFGYYITSVDTIENNNTENIQIKIKNYKSDYLYLLKKDLEATSYIISSASANLANDIPADVIINIGY